MMPAAVFAIVPRTSRFGLLIRSRPTHTRPCARINAEANNGHWSGFAGTSAFPACILDAAGFEMLLVQNQGGAYGFAAVPLELEINRHIRTRSSWIGTWCAAVSRDLGPSTQALTSISSPTVRLIAGLLHTPSWKSVE